MFQKNSEPIIKFISTTPFLTEVPEALPHPAQKFVPQWWKEMHLESIKTTATTNWQGNIKNCPSFPDFFSSGYILPMWADTILKYDSATDIVNWKTTKDFNWDFHTKSQFLDDVPYTYKGQNAAMVFKALCPWQIITAKGYSVYQLPLFYHYENKFMVMPGVIDTDRHHEINQQVMIFDKDEEIFIKRGTPLVQYIPFKREKSTFEVKEMSDKDEKEIKRSEMRYRTSFTGSRDYAKNKDK